MSFTQSIYHDEPYEQSIEAVVRKVLQLPDFQPPRTGIVLDRSIFYPEGGGQPGDRGTLADHDVLDTRKAESLSEIDGSWEIGDIVHIVPLTSLLKIGDLVTITLDWERRYDFMQQHSGQHLISAAFWQVGRYPTISVHQGEDYTTVEFEAGDIPDADIVKATRMANAAILADLPIVSRLVTSDELPTLPLRRELKARDNIRILEIGPNRRKGNRDERPGEILSDGIALPLPFDTVGCGGVHLQRCGEVRIIQHLKTERIRGRVRLYWKIGNRALSDYGLKHRVSDELGTLLSRSVAELPRRVRQMQDELVNLRRRLREMQREVIYGELEDAIASGHGRSGEPVLAEILPGGDMNLLRDSVKRLQKQNVEFAVLVGHNDDEPNKVFWCILDGRQDAIDFPALKASVLDPAGARGGGKPPLWQGSLETEEDEEPETRAGSFMKEIISGIA